MKPQETTRKHVQNVNNSYFVRKVWKVKLGLEVKNIKNIEKVRIMQKYLEIFRSGNPTKLSTFYDTTKGLQNTEKYCKKLCDRTSPCQKVLRL